MLLRRDVGLGGVALGVERAVLLLEPFSYRTLERASERLGIVKGPDGFGKPWLWRFPGAVSPVSASVAQSRQGEKLGETEETAARLSVDGETGERQGGYL